MTAEAIATAQAAFPSERARLQDRLADWLSTWTSAPYGVITDLKPVEGRTGKVRTITFGLARTLDATLWVWSLKRLDLKTSRHEDVRFESELAFREFCVQTYGAPEAFVHTDESDND